MTEGEKIGALMQGAKNLTHKDRLFADSLIDNWNKKKSLSDKQWYWVGVLLDRARSVGVPDFFSTAGAPSPLLRRVQKEVQEEMLAHKASQS